MIKACLNPTIFFISMTKIFEIILTSTFGKGVDYQGDVSLHMSETLFDLSHRFSVTRIRPSRVVNTKRNEPD